MLRRSLSRVAAVAAIVWAAVAGAFAQDWPQFRGPTGQGLAADADAPLEWTANQHVAWKQPIPGRGWSSPVVAGERVWLTTAVMQGAGAKSLRLISLDFASG